VGITDNGYELQQDTSWENISTSDAFGDSLLDGIFRGGGVRLTFESKRFAVGALTPFYPWNTLGTLASPASPIGRLASDVASAMILSAVAGTAFAGPAAGAPGAPGINTLPASKAILAPNSPARLLFSSRLRQIPISLVLLPYVNGANTIWFSTT
jgi:hypothetical protein